jgi:hypothetical protein
VLADDTAVQDGVSIPITVGDAIFFTCYSGCAESSGDPGDQKNLMRQGTSKDWSSAMLVEVPEGNAGTVAGPGGQAG